MQLTANAVAADREAVESADHASRRGAHRGEAITVQTAVETQAHLCLDDADQRPGRMLERGRRLQAPERGPETVPQARPRAPPYTAGLDAPQLATVGPRGGWSGISECETQSLGDPERRTSLEADSVTPAGHPKHGLTKI